MPTIFTHAIVAATVGTIYTKTKMPRRFWVLAIACSMLPDVDVVGLQFGIKYGDLLGHRGLSHSLPFALLVGFLVVLCAFRTIPRFSKRWWSLVLFFFFVTASHGILDAFTSGGLGVAFFSPFDTTRYFFPWRPLRVSPRVWPIGGFLSQQVLERVFAAMMSEFMWIWIPLILCVLAVLVFKGSLSEPQRNSGQNREPNETRLL